MPVFSNPLRRPAPLAPASAQQHAADFTNAMDALQASSQDIRSPGELGARLMADALLQWGKNRADRQAAGGAAAPGLGDFAGRTGFAHRPIDPALSAPVSGLPQAPATAQPGFDFNAIKRPGLAPLNPFRRS